MTFDPYFPGAPVAACPPPELLPPLIHPNKQVLADYKDLIETWQYMNVWSAFAFWVLYGKGKDVRRTMDGLGLTDPERVWSCRNKRMLLGDYQTYGTRLTKEYLCQYFLWVCISDFGPMVDTKHYPHTCTFCGAPAYIGAVPAALDCSKKCRP